MSTEVLNTTILIDFYLTSPTSDKNGNQYEGQWKNDRAQGYGVKLFAKGDKHEGEYKEDKRNG